MFTTECALENYLKIAENYLKIAENFKLIRKYMHKRFSHTYGLSQKEFLKYRFFFNKI